ncbi:GNAT family N-acetyltransferase [Salinibacillus xinjiangensis]|uniref:GNAT family N-acetyltransferase n=1 Tax=Salinibacillus xinjiangensis TaxID=1229268 RepID=A0A6G1X4N4_9BACI|nr:GNAT family N-acetyltransferase [Salinibacillus xinjiangensis]MRG85907.1 GNAT family N-acetyltransferase [Salinibacillus xinjiangensis]
MTIKFIKMTTPTENVIEMMNRWENDPALIPLKQPIQNESKLHDRDELTIKDVRKRLENHDIYLIYLNEQLIGEMNFMIDPGHLYKKEPGTAWIGITIGEPQARGKGIGGMAMQYLEDQIQKQGFRRIELGVFEFNKPAHRLYKKLGYREIGRIENFTYWKGEMWTDIPMEKFL